MTVNNANSNAVVQTSFYDLLHQIQRFLTLYRKAVNDDQIPKARNEMKDYHRFWLGVGEASITNEKTFKKYFDVVNHLTEEV